MNAAADTVVGIALGDARMALVAGCRNEVPEERRHNTQPAGQSLYPEQATDWNRLRKTLADTVSDILREVGASQILALGIAVPTLWWLRDRAFGDRLRLGRRLAQGLGDHPTTLTSPHPIAVALGYFFGPYSPKPDDEGLYLVFHAGFDDAYAAVVEVRDIITATARKTVFSLLAEEHHEREWAAPPTDQTFARLLEDHFRIPENALYDAARYVLLRDSNSLSGLSKADTSEIGIDADGVLDLLADRGTADNIAHMVRQACDTAGISKGAIRKAFVSGGSGVYADFLPDLGLEVDPRYLERNEASRPAAEGALVIALAHTGEDFCDLLLPAHAEYGLVFDQADGEKLVRLVPAHAQLPACVNFEVALEQDRGTSQEHQHAAGRDIFEFRLWRGLGASPDTAMFTQLAQMSLPTADPRRRSSPDPNGVPGLTLALQLKVSEDEEKVILELPGADSTGRRDYLVSRDFSFR